MKRSNADLATRAAHFYTKKEGSNLSPSNERSFVRTRESHNGKKERSVGRPCANHRSLEFIHFGTPQIINSSFQMAASLSNIKFLYSINLNLIVSRKSVFLTCQLLFDR